MTQSDRPKEGRARCTGCKIGWLAWTLRVAAVLFGGIQAWSNRNVMNPDGMSYLDIGSAYARGDLQHAVNSYWSPLYSWLIALGLRIFRPSPAFEFPIIRAVNYLLFVLSLAALEWFVWSLVRWFRERPEGDGRPVPAATMLMVAYALVFASAAYWLPVYLATPDLAVSALTYAAAALLIRALRNDGRPSDFAWLGATLGAAYLAKTALFAIALPVVVGVVISAWPGPLRRRRAMALPVVFLSVCAPWIAAVSIAAGRLTIGSTGAINYAWFVSGGHPFQYTGLPVQRDLPSGLYLFDGGQGTFAPWYDPARWYSGVRPHFDAARQIEAIRMNLYSVEVMILVLGVSLGAGVLLLLGIECARTYLRRLACLWPVWLLGLSGLAVYCLVLVEPRYVAPSVTLLLLSIIGALPLREGTLVRCLAIGAGLLAIGPIALAIVPMAAGFVSTTVDDHQLRAANALARMGARPGDRVAVLRMGNDDYWARLDRLKIIAGTFDRPGDSDREFKVRAALSGAPEPSMYDELRRLRVRFLVGQNRAGEPMGPGWQDLDGSSYAAFPVR